MVEIYEQEEVSFDSTDVEYAIQKGRGDKTEFYPTIPSDTEKLSATACSLANSGGGQIFLGVSKEGTIVGVDEEDIESKAVEIIKQNIERVLDLKLVTSTIEINGDTIIVISISEFRNLPLAASGRFYQRHRKEDILLSPNEVLRLMNEASDD